jgi:hypothetical protein
MGKTFGCSIIPAVVYPYCEVLFLSKETENNIFLYVQVKRDVANFPLKISSKLVS